MLVKVSVGSHWMDSQCFSSLLATDRRCMRESIVSNIVSTIQLLFTTSACPASQPSRVRRGIETHTHTHTQRCAAFILPARGAACVKAPGEPSVSVCWYMAAASRKQPKAKE